MLLIVEHVSKEVKEVEVKISEHKVIMKENRGPDFKAIDDTINQSKGNTETFYKQHQEISAKHRGLPAQQGLHVGKPKDGSTERPT